VRKGYSKEGQRKKYIEQRALEGEGLRKPPARPQVRGEQLNDACRNTIQLRGRRQTPPTTLSIVAQSVLLDVSF